METPTPSPNSSSNLDAATVVNPEDAEIDAKITELHGVYDGEMKEFSPGKRHNKVIVLLLYWDKVGGSYHDLEDEVSFVILNRRNCSNTNVRCASWTKSSMSTIDTKCIGRA
jgi:hypothetical protein